MQLKFRVSGTEYGEIMTSNAWREKLGHIGVEIEDKLSVQLHIHRPNYFQLSDEKSKDVELIDPDVPLYYFSGKITKIARDESERDILKNRRLHKKVTIRRTLMIIDCGMPVRTIIEYAPNEYKEGEFIEFEGRLDGILFTDPEPIVMPVKGKVKEKFEREDYTVYITLDVEEIGKLKIQEDYPFWIENK